MNIKELRYLEYLSRLTNMDRTATSSYWRLFEALYNIDYYSVIDNDTNRAIDGVTLREHFDYDTNNKYGICTLIGDKPCSVLEMMIALSSKMEEDFLYNDEEYVPIIFLEMIDNLGLSAMTDNNSDQEYVESVIDRFLRRDFEYDGYGSLFVLRHPFRDLRDVETWMAMTWYLNERY